MTDATTAIVSTEIVAPPAVVWSALTDPAKVKQWMFGTEMRADWQVGGRVYFRGEWDGKPYEDHGDILAIEAPRLLTLDFYSSVGGLPDVPESYQPITYELTPSGTGTRLTITHENNPDAETAERMRATWTTTLAGLKDVAESAG